MELKIYSPTEEGFLKSIEWNHEEIKREVAERVRYYKNLDCRRKKRQGNIEQICSGTGSNTEGR